MKRRNYVKRGRGVVGIKGDSEVLAMSNAASRCRGCNNMDPDACKKCMGLIVIDDNVDAIAEHNEKIRLNAGLL